MKWKDLPKIDCHVHILPEDRRKGFIKYEGEDSLWGNASLENYIKEMDRNNIKKAILQPTNDIYMYYTMRETNEFLGNVVAKYPDRFFAFSDLNANGSYILDQAPKELEYAVKELNLSGLKIHPNNLNLDADDLRLVPVLRKAGDLNIPVIYHSNPSMMGFSDNGDPDKINKMIKVFPDIDFILAHMGGTKYLDAWAASTYVDISFVLIELVDFYGMRGTERILKNFGADRLIFGTDYPEVSYEDYFEILDSMDFTPSEMEKIAYGNISKILDI